MLAVELPMKGFFVPGLGLVDENAVGHRSEARGNRRSDFRRRFLAGRVVARKPPPRVLGLALAPHLGRRLHEVKSSFRVFDKIAHFDVVVHPLRQRPGGRDNERPTAVLKTRRFAVEENFGDLQVDRVERQGS